MVSVKSSERGRLFLSGRFSLKKRGKGTSKARAPNNVLVSRRIL
jgi:hypothetical protein